jgi:hypothetical protein
MILTTILLSTTIIVILTLILSVKKIKKYDFSGLFLIFSILSLTSGILLIIFSSSDISLAFSRQSWPAKTATVIETDIIGERAYTPQLKSKYEIEGNEYTLTTDLKTPGFGRKKTRRQTSEIILSGYPIGSKVKIHYNPENPGDAYIRTGPYWSDYLRLAIGVLLFASGMYVVLGITIKKYATG